jgi:hypothetical protein
MRKLMVIIMVLLMIPTGCKYDYEYNTTNNEYYEIVDNTEPVENINENVVNKNTNSENELTETINNDTENEDKTEPIENENETTEPIISEPVENEPELNNSETNENKTEPVINEPTENNNSENTVNETTEPENYLITEPIIENNNEPELNNQETNNDEKETEMIEEPENYLIIDKNVNYYNDGELYKYLTSNDSELDGTWESETEKIQFISRRDFKYWNDKNNKEPTFEGSIKTYKDTDENWNQNDYRYLSGRLSDKTFVIFTRFKFVNCDWTLNGYDKELILGTENNNMRFIKRVRSSEPVFN